MMYTIPTACLLQKVASCCKKLQKVLAVSKKMPTFAATKSNKHEQQHSRGRRLDLCPGRGESHHRNDWEALDCVHQWSNTHDDAEPGEGHRSPGGPGLSHCHGRLDLIPWQLNTSLRHTRVLRARGSRCPRPWGRRTRASCLIRCCSILRCRDIDIATYTRVSSD